MPIVYIYSRRLLLCVSRRLPKSTPCPTLALALESLCETTRGSIDVRGAPTSGRHAPLSGASLNRLFLAWLRDLCLSVTTDCLAWCAARPRPDSLTDMRQRSSGVQASLHYATVTTCFAASAYVRLMGPRMIRLNCVCRAMAFRPPSALGGASASSPWLGTTRDPCLAGYSLRRDLQTVYAVSRSSALCACV